MRHPPRALRPPQRQHASVTMEAPSPIYGTTRRLVVSSLLATAGMSVLPAGPALALGTAAAAATLQTFEVECSEFDTRSFRGLRLPNGLRVLLCSDPAAKKAAAAMDVQVGWMSDARPRL